MDTSEKAVTAKIPFEIKSSDEKFLKAATELGAIKDSVLDVCHHTVGMEHSLATNTFFYRYKRPPHLFIMQFLWQFVCFKIVSYT